MSQPLLSRSLMLTIVVAGLIAGTLDILGAIVSSAFHQVSPVRVLQSVASGLLGRSAYEGGAATAALGLLLHFAIMQVIAGIFVLVAQCVQLLNRQAVAFGVLYGVTVYFFMKAVVLPLSAFPGKPSYAVNALAVGIFVHILCVGLPIALLSKRVSNPQA
jgi:hypothetical protein